LPPRFISILPPLHVYFFVFMLRVLYSGRLHCSVVCWLIGIIYYNYNSRHLYAASNKQTYFEQCKLHFISCHINNIAVIVVSMKILQLKHRCKNVEIEVN